VSGALLVFEPDDGTHGGEQLGVVVPILGRVVAQVSTADLRLSTPCDGWTTRDLLNHVIGGAEMFAGALQGGPLRDISGRNPDVVGDDPTAAFGRAAEAFGAATQAGGAMERLLPLPFGTMTGETFLRFAAFDLLVHSWDLGRTLDVDVDVPDDVVLQIDRFARQLLSPGVRDGVNFAPEVVVDPGAAPLDRLVALSGRTP
jgi:uncharacterized protein (TIGR03086 family)